jgi:predicted RNA-binding Zn ribbon-like protein
MPDDGTIERRSSGDRLLGRLRFDAGSLSLNLVATVGRRFGRPVERLSDVARLEAWLAGVGLHAERPPNAAQLVRVQALREELDALFRRVLEGKPPSATMIETINDAAGRAPAPRLRGTRTGVTLERPGFDAVLGSIAADAIRILTSEDRSRLRTCEAPDCRMLYLAGPRRSRRWCSSEHCGNRARVARHRARADLASVDSRPGGREGLPPRRKAR